MQQWSKKVAEQPPRLIYNELGRRLVRAVYQHFMGRGIGEEEEGEREDEEKPKLSGRDSNGFSRIPAEEGLTFSGFRCFLEDTERIREDGSLHHVIQSVDSWNEWISRSLSSLEASSTLHSETSKDGIESASVLPHSSKELSMESDKEHRPDRKMDLKLFVAFCLEQEHAHSILLDADRFNLSVLSASEQRYQRLRRLFTIFGQSVRLHLHCIPFLPHLVYEEPADEERLVLTIPPWNCR